MEIFPVGVKFCGDVFGDRERWRPPAPLSLKPPSTGKPPEPLRRRSYAETVSSPSCVSEKKTEKPVKTKRPEKDKVQKSRWPVTYAQPVALKSAAVVPAMGRPIFSMTIASFLEGDQLSEFKDMLLRIKGDVERCINWLELGRSLPSCGLLGAVPKPKSMKHFGSSSAGGPAKKKQKSGLVVSRPKVFNHAVGKRGPVFPICKPAFKPNRVDKGKAVVEGLRPTSSKTSKKKWVSMQPTSSGATHVRAPVANPGPATGMDLSDGLMASSSTAPIAIAPTRKPLPSPLCIPEALAVLVVESEMPVLAVGRSLKEDSDLSVKPLEVSSGPEASLGSAVLISDAVVSGSSTEMLGSELARVPELSNVIEAAEVDAVAAGGGLASEMVGSELALISEMSVSAEAAGVIVGAAGGGMTPVLASHNGLLDPLLRQLFVPNSPGDVMPSPTVVSRNSGGSDLDDFVEQPSPLLCCPAYKARGKTGAQSSDWVLQLVMVSVTLWVSLATGLKGNS